MRTLSGLRGRHTDPARLRADVLAVLRDAAAGLDDSGSDRSPST